MTIIDKIENMPIEFVDENGNKGFLEFKRGWESWIKPQTDLDHLLYGQ